MEFKRAVLDVETSVTGYFWRDRGKDERLAIGYAQQLGLPEIVGRVLVNRDVTPDELQSYLDPRLKDLMPDPSSFVDMDKAAERIADAIRAGNKITIFGDYDVDGATSSSLLCRYIAAAGGQADFYIPDRMAEGYGPNLPALQKIAGAGADLIITVDCGISAFDVLDGAADQGIEVVVVDHHMAEPRLPKAVAVVNPNRLDCNSGQGKLAAVGVAFGRGFCPFTCTFCGVDGYRRQLGVPLARATRLRTVDRILAELARARTQVPCDDGFAAWDEVLPVKPSFLADMAPRYRDEVALPFACQLRVEQVTPRVVDALVTMGCDYAVMGVECGDEAYRKRFLDKGFSNQAALTAFQRLADAGIAVMNSVMLGLPFETPRQLAATVRLCRDLPAAELSFKYYTPETGTRLHGLCAQHDLLLPHYVDHPFGANEAMIRLTHCTQGDIDTAMAALRQVRGGGDRGTFEQQGERPIALELRA